MLVLTFLWSNGWQAPGTFAPEHVLGLKNMLAKHLTLAHRFVCICSSDYHRPVSELGIETYPLWDSPAVRTDKWAWNSFVRLGLLGEPGAAISGGDRRSAGRFLMLDLDTVIRANIDDIALDVYFAPLRIYCGGTFGAPLQNGLRRGYNGCLWGGELGALSEAWVACASPETVRRATSQYIGSDQAMLSYLYPSLPTWTERDGIALRPEPQANWCIACLSGSAGSKPWNDERWREIWHREAGFTGCPPVSPGVPRRMRSRLPFRAC